MSAALARLLPALAVACLAATAALADDVDRVQPGDRFAADVTYADLIRRIVPDFDAANGARSRILDLRRLDSGDVEQASLAPFKISSVPVVLFDDAGEPVQTFYCIDGAVGYAISGEIGREQLERISELVYRQLPAV